MKIQLSEHFTYKKLLRFVLPSIIMMIFTSIYSVVDGLFVSNFVGKTALAAINLTLPIIMGLSALGFMIGTGGSAIVARMLGEKKREKANEYFSMLIYVTAIGGILLSILGAIFIPAIASLLGAKGQLLSNCILYARLSFISMPAFMLQNVFQSFLAAAEKPRLGLAVTVAAGVTNAVLDAVFMAGFGWGLTGAALATGIGQCVGGLLPLLYFARPNSSLLRLTRTRLQIKPIRKACANGSSELMSNISSSLVSMVYNWQLLRLIGQDGVSAYGVLMYVQFIFAAISIGYSIGSAPIVSYHYGAGHTDELKNLLHKSKVIMLSTGAVLTLLATGLAGPLAKLFVGYDAGLHDLTTHAFRLFAFSFLLGGFNIFASGFFTALNDGGVSAAISFLRTLVFQLLSVVALPALVGVDGIWLAITVAETCAFIISMIFLKAKQPKYQY